MGTNRPNGGPITDRSAVDVLNTVAVGVLAGSLRWSSIPSQGFFFDDSWVVTGAVSSSSRQLLVGGSAHPGFTLLLKALDAVVGHSTRAMTAPAMVVGILGPPLAYLCLRQLRCPKSVAALAATLLAVNPTHLAYSGRPKSYVFDLAIVLALAALLPRLAERRWTVRLAVTWPVLMVVAGSFSGYLTVATAVATGILVLHPKGDVRVRIAALAAQGAVQGALYLGSKDTADMAGIQQFQENAHDGMPSFSWNPIDLGQEFVRRLGRIAEVYPGGPPRAMQIVGVAAVATLVVVAVGRARQPRWTVTARFLVALVGGAFVASFATMMPFGNTSTDWISEAGSTGGRHNLWLVPVILVGAAFLLTSVRTSVGRHARTAIGARADRHPTAAVRVIDVALCLVLVASVVDRPAPLPYPAIGSQIVVRQAMDWYEPDDAMIIVGDLVYPMANGSGLAHHLVATPTQQVGFTPAFDDPSVHTMGIWTTRRISKASIAAAVGDHRRVVVIGVSAGWSSVDLLRPELLRLGFTQAQALTEGLYVVSVWERPAAAA